MLHVPTHSCPTRRASDRLCRRLPWRGGKCQPESATCWRLGLRIVRRLRSWLVSEVFKDASWGFVLGRAVLRPFRIDHELGAIKAIQACGAVAAIAFLVIRPFSECVGLDR